MLLCGIDNYKTTVANVAMNAHLAAPPQMIRNDVTVQGSVGGSIVFTREAEN